jgi:hypothetical protein
MNIVINPSGTEGFSFKGLHDYCAHDKAGTTSERVEWVSSHNIAASPKNGYKMMIATAQAQNQLKREAGVNAGRNTKNGPVMHIVMCYDKDEPKDQATREKAAVELLSRLGRDPKKRGGKGATVRQFADEHQAIFYAHTDTKNDHVHIMLNTVHPKHGRRLPTSNDQIKASRWALEFSKKYGTDKKTPAREENMLARDRGEYVKAKNRKSRKTYEEEKALKEASNDNKRIKKHLEQQKQKAADLYAKGRLLKDRQAARLADIEERLEDKKAKAAEDMKAKINKSKADIREQFRPLERELKTRQDSELKTFNALEASFFGRTKNALNNLKSAFQDGEKNIIARSFRILSNSGERKQYFDRAQARELNALEKQKAEKISLAIKAAKADKSDADRKATALFVEESKTASLVNAAENEDLKTEWKAYSAEQKKELAAFEALEKKRPPMRGDFGQAKTPTDYYAKLDERLKLSDEFNKGIEGPAKEQDNERDEGQER